MPEPRRRRLEVEHIGDLTVVKFADRRVLDDQDAQLVTEQLFGLVDELGRRKVLLNFGNVEHLSSPFLGRLLTLNKKLQSVGGRLTLCNVEPVLMKVFEITGLDRLLYILPEGDNDPQADPGGVGSRLKPPKPSGGQSVALQPPPPEPECS